LYSLLLQKQVMRLARKPIMSTGSAAKNLLPEIQTANAEIFQQRWPEVWQVITQCQPFDDVVIADNTPEQTLLINNLQLTSAYSRANEALVQSHLIEAGSKEAAVYGFALGDLPRNLLARDELEKLYVVILSPAATFWSLVYFDHTDWLQDPRVELKYAGHEENVRRPFAAAPVCLRLADDASTRIKDLVRLLLNQNHMKNYFNVMEDEMVEQIEENIPLVNQDEDVASLYNTRKGVTAVAVAGGPTATEQFAWIKQYRDQLYVVAVTTALVPLAQAGIIPDVTIAIDHKFDLIEHFKGLDMAQYEKVPFVYVPCVHKGALHAWPGPRHVALLRKMRGLEIIQEKTDKQSFVFAGGTVTNSAVDLAVKVGAERIILVGVDFAYPGGQSHATGATLPEDTTNNDGFGHAWAINGYDERVQSSHSLILYLRELELYVKEHPSVIFINTGKTAAKILGTCWMKNISSKQGELNIEYETI
jgi:hypothetical protein